MSEKRKTKSTPESLLKDRVVRHLKKMESLGKLVFWRSSAGLCFTRTGRMIRLGRTGMPDIMVLSGGTLIAIELKSECGRLEESQKELRPLLEAQGCRYHVVRSVEDLMLAIG